MTWRNFRQFLTPLPPLSRFLWLRPYNCRHTIIDSLPLKPWRYLWTRVIKVMGNISLIVMNTFKTIIIVIVNFFCAIRGHFEWPLKKSSEKGLQMIISYYDWIVYLSVNALVCIFGINWSYHLSSMDLWGWQCKDVSVAWKQRQIISLFYVCYVYAWL